MTKQEFLHELQTALQGEISRAAINENIRYYDSYIMEETRKGKMEEEVIERLGNPRLIAKTLIDTTEQFGTYGRGSYYSDDDMPNGAGGARRGYQKQRRWSLNTWYGKLFMIIAAIFLIVIVANVVAFLLPLLAPVILLLLIYSLIFGSRR